MTIDPVAAKRSRSHTKYFAKDGTLLPGVTTILGVLAKPALVPWANKLGLAGVEVGKYVDSLAIIGTIAHDMICCHNRGAKYEPDGVSPDLVDRAENSFLSYLQWEKGKRITPILCEAKLVSEIHGFGGTCDMLADVDDMATLTDYKTGKAIYAEHVYQAAAYRILLRENGHKVDAIRILQIGRDETEGFSEKVVLDTEREEKIFLLCLELYKLRVGR